MEWATDVPNPRGPRRPSYNHRTMSTLLLKNGRVIDPSANLDRVADLWLADGHVVGLGPQSLTPTRILDCAGKIVSPGLIDMHVHLREPGREEDETIATGTALSSATTQPPSYPCERYQTPPRKTQYSSST